jgi:hypothetical protein
MPSDKALQTAKQYCRIEIEAEGVKHVTAKPDIEEGLEFMPRFGEDGLIPAIAQDARSGLILMVAYMNRQALEQTSRVTRPISAAPAGSYGRKASKAGTFKRSNGYSSIVTRIAWFSK